MKREQEMMREGESKRGADIEGEREKDECSFALSLSLSLTIVSEAAIAGMHSRDPLLCSSSLSPPDPLSLLLQ